MFHLFAGAQNIEGLGRFGSKVGWKVYPENGPIRESKEALGWVEGSLGLRRGSGSRVIGRQSGSGGSGSEIRPARG